MKKRLLSALLALALVFVLLPTTALAEVTTGDDYDISINGRGWKFEKDTTSGAYIPVYYYHTGVFDNANNKNRTNDNLELTKEGNTVTITIRRGTSHDYRVYPIEFTLEKISTTSGSPYDFTPCIEMGNGNSLVITGKGTLNITRDEKNGIGAALCSEVGDITITDGITVKANFLKQVSNSTVGNAISVKDHNLIISGKNTKVEARNSSCNFQDLYDVSATVCVENGEIKVSDGATLSAINNFTNSHTSQYSYYSRAISGSSSSKPCALTVTGENSCVIAETDNSLGKAYGHVNFSIDGAKIEVGTSSPAQTITDINNIKNYKYAKISVPALQRTSDVFIAGEKAVVGQWTTITADSCSGSYFYDADKKELTLKDITITRNNNNNVNHAIQFTKNGDYTINLEGANNISSVTDGICALNNAFYDNPANISVTITGTGSLNVIANTYAIDMQVGNLIFNNTGNITLTTNTNYTVQKTVCNALRVKSGSITIDNTKYDIVGARQEKNYPTETISDSSAFTPDLLNGYTVGEETTLFKTITITPAAAKDSTISYDGTTLKQGETIKDGKGGTATVATKGNTITLNNFKGTKALSFDATLADSTLVLEGTNTLSSIVTTQKDLTISGSLTVGSIKVHNQKTSSDDKPNLTINGGAHVTVNRPSSEDKPVVEVSGNLTVTGEGTQLSAECTAATNPAIEVGGNVTISGNPGTNAYTVKAYNKYAAQRGRDDNLRPSQMPSAFEISGNLSISGSAQVMAQTDSDGAAVWMPKEKVISVADASLIAQNSSHNFSTISFGDEDDMGNIYAKGQEVNIVAKNMLGSNSSLAHKAIKAFIYNHYNTGDSNPYYINVVSEGVQSGGNVNVIPGHCTSTGGYKVTITRGDAYTTPQVAANYTIAGQTMHVGKYYKTDAKGNITDGTAQDYNIYCDSKNDFTLNNATISSTGTDVAINTNIRYETNVQHHIKLIGTNRINNTFKHAISAGSNSSTIIIEGVGNASDASLTINGNFLPIYSDGKVIINAEVVIVNTTDDNSFKGLISTSDGKGAFDLGSGYKCYASTSTTGTPLEEFNSANYSTYKYLRVTKENLAPTTPTTYTVTITAGDNMKHESGALTQEVTKGAAITEVKFMAASGHYFPADYVSKMNLPAGLTAEIRENSWYLIISGTPTSDVTINLPAASVRPTITVSMPTPAAGNTPATASDITLTYSDINKSISKNLTISNVVWQSYVSNGDGSITPGNTLSSGDKFVEGTEYYVTIDFEGVSENYAIVPAADTTAWRNAEWGSRTMTLYFNVTGAPCNHEYTNDWLANGNTHWHECKLCRAHAGEVAHTFGDWITDTPATDTTDGSKHRTCSVCQYQENATIPKTGTGEIVPPTPDNPGTIVIIRPAEEEKPAQQPNPSTGANDLVGLAVAAAVAAALGSAALLRKHD